MKDKLKDYKKPTIDVVEVQWNECIAGSARLGVTVHTNSTPVNDTTIWFGDDISGWNNNGF